MSKWGPVIIFLVVVVANVIGNLIKKAKKGEDERRRREAAQMRQQQMAGGPGGQPMPGAGPRAFESRPPAQTLAEQRRAQIEQLRQRRAGGAQPAGGGQHGAFGMPKDLRVGSSPQTTPFPLPAAARAAGRNVAIQSRLQRASSPRNVPMAVPKQATGTFASQIKTQRLKNLDISKATQPASRPSSATHTAKSAPADRSEHAVPAGVTSQPAAEQKPKPSIAAPPAGFASIKGLRAGLVSRKALRELVALKEILDPPVALRL